MTANPPLRSGLPATHCNVMHKMNMKNTLIIVATTLVVSGLSFYGGLYVATNQNNELINKLSRIYATQGVENEIAQINIHLFYMDEINKENNRELVNKTRHFVKLSLNQVKDLISKDMIEKPMLKTVLESAQKFVDEKE